MNCPNCNAMLKMRILDSRHMTNYIYRRRQCLGCQHKWTTYELREADMLGGVLKLTTDAADESRQTVLKRGVLGRSIAGLNLPAVEPSLGSS